MSTQTTYRSQLDVYQQFDTTTTNGGTDETNNTTTAVLNDTSTPPITEGGYFVVPVSASPINLRTITTTRGRRVDLNAQRPRQLKLSAPTSNGAGVTITVGASNGYTGYDAAFKITLLPGMEVTICDRSTAGVAAVSDTVKTLDLTGTSSDVVQVSFGAGA